MKLKNTTDYDDHFLRRLTAWVCKQCGMPVKQLLHAEFRNAKGWHAYTGTAWTARFVVRIGSDKCFPTQPDGRPGMSNEVFADRLEGLVAITAHEVEHLAQRNQRRQSTLRRVRGRLERVTRAREIAVLRLFRQHRDELVAKWSQSPKKRERRARPVLSKQEQRHEATRKRLAQWERKLKLANTKVKTYRKRLGYYERAAASKEVAHD
jgi:hypothetical protein